MEPLMIPSNVKLSGALTEAAARAFGAANDCLEEIGDAKTIRRGVKLAAFAKRLKALANEAYRLGL